MKAFLLVIAVQLLSSHEFSVGAEMDDDVDARVKFSGKLVNQGNREQQSRQSDKLSCFVGDDGGVSNVVMWLVDDEGGPVENAAESTEPLVVSVNPDGSLSPRIAVLDVGQALSFRDPNRSNFLILECPANIVIGSQDERHAWRRNVDLLQRESVTVDDIPRTRLPILVGDPLNRSQPSRIPFGGFVFVASRAAVAVSDSRGEFSFDIDGSAIQNDVLRLRLWHEAVGYIPQVVIDGVAHDLSKGVLRISREAVAGGSLGTLELTDRAHLNDAE